MANYRFKTAEIEAMKKNILTQIEHEAETKTAWRLRCAIEGQLMCCRPSKREAARLERELALYEKLTKNDLPNWQSEPTQPATPTETPQIPTEAAETVNVSAEGEKGAEKAIYAFISKAETILDKIKQKCLNREIYVEDASRYEFMVCMAVSNFVNKHKNCPTEPPQSPEAPRAIECATDTPKPRETARKPQNRAIGSAQHRQHSALGANAYAVLNDASATMAAMNVRCDTLRDTLHSVTYVPRECSTANSPPYW